MSSKKYATGKKGLDRKIASRGSNSQETPPNGKILAKSGADQKAVHRLTFANWRELCTFAMVIVDCYMVIVRASH